MGVRNRYANFYVISPEYVIYPHTYPSSLIYSLLISFWFSSEATLQVALVCLLCLLPKYADTFFLFVYHVDRRHWAVSHTGTQSFIPFYINGCIKRIGYVYSILIGLFLTIVSKRFNLWIYGRCNLVYLYWGCIWFFLGGGGG